MATLSGSRAFESDLHRKFCEFRISGEWFRPDSSILAFIEANGIRWTGLQPGDRPTKEKIVKEKTKFVPQRSEIYISVQDAAKELNVSRPRIQALIMANRLPAEKVGNQYVIQRDDLAKVKIRKPGRPRKSK